jgi:hypothetical protein
MGRWISQDPISFKAGDPNLYRYVHNVPTSRMDANGMGPSEWSGAGTVGGAIGGGIATYFLITAGVITLGPVGIFFLGGVALGAIVGGFFATNFATGGTYSEFFVGLGTGFIAVYAVYPSLVAGATATVQYIGTFALVVGARWEQFTAATRNFIDRTEPTAAYLSARIAQLEERLSAVEAALARLQDKDGADLSRVLALWREKLSIQGVLNNLRDVLGG